MKNKKQVIQMYQRYVIGYYEDVLHDDVKCHNWMALMAIEKICEFLKLLGCDEIVVSHVDWFNYDIDWGQFLTEMEFLNMKVIFDV